eukprot:scaffold6618_cov139-Isochrysis_galbana.AAC.5
MKARIARAWAIGWREMKMKRAPAALAAVHIAESIPMARALDGDFSRRSGRDMSQCGAHCEKRRSAPALSASGWSAPSREAPEKA